MSLRRATMRFSTEDIWKSLKCEINWMKKKKTTLRMPTKVAILNIFLSVIQKVKQETPVRVYTVDKAVEFTELSCEAGMPRFNRSVRILFSSCCASCSDTARKIHHKIKIQFNGKLHSLPQSKMSNGIDKNPVPSKYKIPNPNHYFRCWFRSIFCNFLIS